VLPGCRFLDRVFAEPRNTPGLRTTSNFLRAAAMSGLAGGPCGTRVVVGPSAWPLLFIRISGPQPAPNMECGGRRTPMLYQESRRRRFGCPAEREEWRKSRV